MEFGWKSVLWNLAGNVYGGIWREKCTMEFGKVYGGIWQEKMTYDVPPLPPATNNHLEALLEEIWSCLAILDGE